MNYDKAYKIVEEFVRNKFSHDLKDDRPIIYIDGGYGIGKSYLGFQIASKYRCFKNRTENDRKLFKKVFNSSVRISLAGKEDISAINKDLSKHLRTLFSLLEKLFIFIGTGFWLFLSRLIFRIKAKDIPFNTYILLKIKSVFRKVIVIVDELDRKCDKLDLNSVFAFLYDLANSKNVRVIVIGDTFGIINREERLKAISYRDKVCKNIITITEPSESVISNKINKKSFAISRFPRINDVSKNIRVVSKAKQIIDQIGMDLSDAQRLAAHYILLCYFENEESGYFNKAAQNILSPLISRQNESTILVSQKYKFKLFDYCNRQNLIDTSLIFTLISDGTFNLRQINEINNILLAALNIEKIEVSKDFRAINFEEVKCNEDLVKLVDETAANFTNKIVYNNFTCDLHFVYCGKNLKNLPSAIGSNTYPIDFKAFLPSESIAAKMNLSANRLKYEALCILDYGS